MAPSGPRLHGALDYPLAAVLIGGPLLLDFHTGRAQALVLVLGGAAGTLLAVGTAWSRGIVRVLPPLWHGVADTGATLVLIAAPFVLDYSHHTVATLFSILVGVGGLGATLLTRFESDLDAPMRNHIRGRCALSGCRGREGAQRRAPLATVPANGLRDLHRRPRLVARLLAWRGGCVPRTGPPPRRGLRRMARRYVADAVADDVVQDTWRRSSAGSPLSGTLEPEDVDLRDPCQRRPSTRAAGGKNRALRLGPVSDRRRAGSGRSGPPPHPTWASGIGQEHRPGRPTRSSWLRWLGRDAGVVFRALADCRRRNVR